MSNCLFCRILAREIPSEKVYEDDKVYAFLDIKPVNPGHALVIHKHHHADIFDTPEADMRDLAAGARKVAIAVKETLKVDGVNLGMNNGGAAGQVIFHAHLHVIPRRSSDGLKHWPHQDAKPDELKAVAEKLRSALP